MTEDPLHRLHRKHTNAFTNQQYRVWKDKQPTPIKPLSVSSKMTSPLPAVANRVPSTPPRGKVVHSPARQTAVSSPPRKTKVGGLTGARKAAPTAVSPKRKPQTTPTRPKPAKATTGGAKKKAPAASKDTKKKATPQFRRLALPEDPMTFFDQMDGNASGKLSLAELDKTIVEVYPDLNNKPAIMRAYKHTDKSGDGFVSRDEFPAFLQFIVYYNNLWSIFSTVDTDGDRRISKEEFASVAPQFAKIVAKNDGVVDSDVMFESIDRDGKGMILFAELCHYLADQKWNVDQDMMNELHDILQDDSDDDDANKGEQQATTKTPPAKAEPKPDAVNKIKIPDDEQAMKMFDRLDENASGKLSLAELDKAVGLLYPHLNSKAAILRAYKSSDASGDGFVMKDEFMSFLQYIVYYNNLWAVFASVDKDSDGRIQKEEVEKSAHLFAVESSIDDLFSSIDENGGGMILFSELCQYLAKHPDAVNPAAMAELNTTDTIEA